METIILQIVQKAVEKIIKRINFGEIFQLDTFASNVNADMKDMAKELTETVISEINFALKEDKEFRKGKGFIIKEKERPRKILTELGEIDIRRDYYYDKQEEHYTYILDKLLDIKKYQRIGDNISAKLVVLATEMSYAKSSLVVTNGEVSRQTVKNKVDDINVLKKETDSLKKLVKELHIYADEDHIHLQKPNKEKGKKSKSLNLVTVIEGIEKEGTGRNKTKNPMHFVNENFDAKELWNEVENYILQAYDYNNLERIYLHADGGKWIKNGLENFKQRVMVMDGFHISKYLRKLKSVCPKSNTKKRLEKAIEKNDRKEADDILQELYQLVKEDKKKTKVVNDVGTYLMGNWDAIVKRKVLDIPGSCTEAQISHILSERFSRDPMGWSQKTVGKLAKRRVYIKNGGEITRDAFSNGSQNRETYLKQGNRIIEEYLENAIDWSIFENPKYTFNGASGTQVLLHKIGAVRTSLVN